MTWFDYSDKHICFHHAYGTILATYAYQIYKKLNDCEDNTLMARHREVTLKADHSMDGKQEEAREIQKVF